MLEQESTYALRLGGRVYDGWKTLSVTRDLSSMSGSFTLSLSATTTDGAVPSVEPGRAAVVEIDGVPILKGWIDTKSISYAGNEHTLTVTGRDKIGDLIDCAATVNGPFEYNNTPLVKVVERIVKPFGITVTNASGSTPIVKRLAIQPGESAFDVIERACRAYGILPVSDGIGGLVLAKPGTERSAGALVYGDNIQLGTIEVSAAERHSLYVVKGQAEAVDANNDDASHTSGGEGRVTDTQVTRYRPKVLVGENQGYSGTLKERALWERKVDRARGMKVSYTVQGWYAAAGAMWKPNTLVKVIDTLGDLNRDMLIAGVTFTRDDRGTLTQLTLALPDAFDIDTKEAAPKSGKGSGQDAAGTIWADDND